MAQGPCAQSSCGSGVTYTPPAGSGNGSGSGGSGGGATYTPPTGGGGSGGGSGSSGSGSSLIEVVKQEAKMNLENDVWFFGTSMIVLYLIIFFVRLIIAMFENIKPHPIVEVNETAEAEKSRDDNEEELDDDYYIPESKFQSEEQEKAWREDLALIVEELDEQDRAKAEAEAESENEKREEEHKQTEVVLEQLNDKYKAPQDDDWEELFNKYKKD